LQQAYFDWNEVRVTTVIELGEALGSLPNPTQAGHRIKRCLQSLFEARYQYDIEDMKKANLGKATEELTAWKGVSPFVLAYVSQNALGGHFIPADTMTLDTLVQADIMTESEAEKKVLPGVERAITKTKGTEFSSLLHQFAVEFQHNQKNATALLVFKDLGVTPKAKPKAASLPEKPKPSKADSAEPTASSSKSIPAETQATPSKKSDKSKAADPVVVAKKEELKKPAAKATPSKAEAIKTGAGKVVAEAPAKPKKSELNKAESKPAVKNPTTKEVAPGKEKAVKKSESKSVPKAAADAGSAKSKPEAKKSTEVKKPAKPVAPKAKAAPAKPSPTKASSKEATNVKITKKKPR